MRYELLRRGALMIALALPLGGCLEVLGSKMNRGPTASQASLCPRVANAAGTVGYGCAPTPAAN